MKIEEDGRLLAGYKFIHQPACLVWMNKTDKLTDKILSTFKVYINKTALVEARGLDDRARVLLNP